MAFMNVEKVSVTGMHPDNSGLSGGHSSVVAGAVSYLSTNLNSRPNDLSLVFSNGKSLLPSTEAISVSIQSNLAAGANLSSPVRG